MNSINHICTISCKKVSVNNTSPCHTVYHNDLKVLVQTYLCFWEAIEMLHTCINVCAKLNDYYDTWDTNNAVCYFICSPCENKTSSSYLMPRIKCSFVFDLYLDTCHISLIVVLWWVVTCCAPLVVPHLIQLTIPLVQSLFQDVQAECFHNIATTAN